MEKALAIQKEVQDILGTDEVYLVVPGYEGLYEVSNFGRVKSVDRVIEHKNNRWGNSHKTRYTGKELKQKIDKYGYPCVCLFNGTKRRYVTVHRLVAEAFIENNSSLPQVNHIDGNKLNNHVSNLEWVSPSQNVSHAIRMGLLVPARGDGLPQTAVDQIIAKEIKEDLITGKYSQVEIARKFNVSKNVVWRIKTGQTWGWL